MTIGNLKKDNYEIIILPSDEFKILSFVNTLYIESGTHIDYILDKLLKPIREKLVKKYKNIKLSDIKNKTKIVVIFKNFPNLEFDSQSKERITNNRNDIDTFLKNIDWDKESKKLQRDKDYISNIVEFYEMKEKLEEKKQLKKLQKTTKIVSDKYTPSIGKREYLFLTEGTSANSFLMKAMGRKNHGYIEMMGVPMNVWNEKITKVANSKKFEIIQKVCGIDYVNKIANPIYDKIVIAADEDIFGQHIVGLIVAYFYRFAPNLLKDGKLFKLKTPLILAFKGNKLVNYFFDFKSYKDYDKENPGLYYEYNKGLGSNDVSVFKEVLKREGLDNLLYKFTYEEVEENIDLWFSKDTVEQRKNVIKQNPFNINML